jgi:hypothetical protein
MDALRDDGVLAALQAIGGGGAMFLGLVALLVYGGVAGTIVAVASILGGGLSLVAGTRAYRAIMAERRGAAR